jgi:pimeloyl-ACP methyl ester carboxylesterase
MRERVVVEGVAGLKIALDETGAGEPVVVWLHSEFGPFSDPPVPAQTLERARFLTLHLPGWGVSQRGDAHIDSLPDLGLALWAVLDELGVGAVSLAGHGIGATTALEMGIQQPQRTRGIVAATPFGIVDAADPGVDTFALLPVDLLPHLYVEPRGALATTHFPAPTTPHEKGLAAIRRVEVLGEAGRYLFPLPDTGIEDRLYRLAKTKVHLLWGEHDGVVPAAIASRWTAALPSARSSVVPGAAHMLPYESSAIGDALDAILAEAVVCG